MDRYHTQTLLDKIGDTGQKKLEKSNICIIGCGGLGAIAAAYLAGAGVGKIQLIDGDMVQNVNLHRQITYKTDQESLKVDSLQRYIQELNPEVTVIANSVWLSETNINELLNNADLVLECTDDIHTKYLVNDHCFKQGIPMIYAGLSKYSGQVSLFENKNDQSIHLRDIYPTIDEGIASCSEVGVLNTIAGIIGLLQANEAIKFICGIGAGLIGKLLIYDALENSQMKIKLKKVFQFEAEKMNSQVPEIDWSEVMFNQSEFTFISLVGDQKLDEITSKTLIMNRSDLEKSSNFEDLKNTKIAIYCRRGNSSKSAVKTLKNLGIKEVYSIRGGMSSFPK